MSETLRHFKFTVRVNWTKEPMVDWYSGATEQEARAIHDEDLHRYGYDPKDCTIEVIEVSELP